MPITGPTRVSSLAAALRGSLRARLKANPAEPAAWHAALSDDEFLEEAFQRTFGRAVDPGARVVYTNKLVTEWSRQDVLNVLESSPEAQQGPGPRLALEAFHSGRVAWTRSLPRAARILDLGGTSLDTDSGALLAMGYPYPFEEIIIIELPPEARHQLYQVPEMKSVPTEHGPVRYMYRSMTDLADLEDQSFDMICSGQTFEHIFPDEGAQLLHDIHRLLKPAGFLALDTPNRAVTKIEVASKGIEFINPDHKVEYTHGQMQDLFAQAGLEVIRQHGIGYMPETVERNEWLVEELIEYPWLYDDIEKCYTLAYLARPKLLEGRRPAS
jgi:predicted SAM-dependent methyltransferase